MEDYMTDTLENRTCAPKNRTGNESFELNEPGLNAQTEAVIKYSENAKKKGIVSRVYNSVAEWGKDAWGQVGKKPVAIYALIGIGLFGYFYCNENARDKENERQLARLKAMPTVEYIVQPGDGIKPRDTIYGIEESKMTKEDQEDLHDDNTLKIFLEDNPKVNPNTKILQPGQRVKLRTSYSNTNQ